MEKPTEEQIEKILIEKKKAQLLRMFNLDELEEIEKATEEVMKENRIQ